MQLTAGFTIQAFESLPPSERERFLEYLRERRDVDLSSPKKRKRKKVKLLPEDENIDFLFERIKDKLLTKATNTQDA